MTQDPSIPFSAPTHATPAWVEPLPFVDTIPDRTAARVIVAMVAAGVLAQLLFFWQAPGINFPIWIAVVLAAGWSFRRADARLDRRDRWLPFAALAFATFIALRDDASLFAFDFLAACSLTLAAVVAIGGHPVSNRAWSAIGRLAGAAIAVFFVGAAHVGGRIGSLAKGVPLSGQSTGARLIRGLLIAVPLVIGFAALFGAADAVFAGYVSRIFRIEATPAELIGRTIFAAIAGWLFAGTMAVAWLSRGRFASAEPAAADPAAAVSRATRLRLGTVETLVVLVALDVLFMAFVVVQAAYLFPGSDPLAVSGLTYSAYARKGFFELIAAAAMAGLVILALDALVEERKWPYRAAAIGLVVLIGVVLVSAAVRLGLYQQVYGWTELRFYVLAAIGWLAIGVIAAVAALVLGRVSTLPKFMLGAGLAVAFACNVIGPQYFVTAQNLQRVVDPSLVPADGFAGLDTQYLGFLGADSVIVALEALPRLPPQDAELLKRTLARQARELRLGSADTSWPSWNLARQSALEALTAAGF